jgi:Spy/CpxP family protein refolding chaperone
MNMKMIKPLLFTTVTALSLGAPLVHAQTAAPADSKAAAADKEKAPPYGGWGPGYGMGPGMMGGYGMGPGWGGYGMGPGWGGYGMGPGMMGGGWGPGYGMGPGMMGGGWGGYGPQGTPDLSADQRAKIGKIQDETRRKNWALMGQMMDEQAKLRDLYDAPKRDSDAINKAYKNINELQARMYESAADAHKRMEGVLTPEQKEKSWRFWRRQ